MISMLEGVLVSKTPSEAVISCGGVGFLAAIPSSVYAELPEAGGRARLYTVLNVREDALELFGFADERQRQTFRLLTSVTGVGPKAALAVLSVYSPDRIALCAASGDYKAFTACAGVGAKLAQRLVLELKDKVGALGAIEADKVQQSGVTAESGAGSEALAALVSLGFSNSEAATALAKLPADLPAEELISRALRGMAK